jgi:NADH-quinone oxidoreductase subunit F
MKITSLAELQAIQEKGLGVLYPARLKIMVGMATCGISAGADKVFQALAAHIAEQGLDVALAKTGCIGYCQREPLVDVIYPGKVRLSYQEMNPEKAGELAEALKAGKILPKYLMCRMDQEEFLIDGVTRPYANPHPPELPVEIPRYQDLPFFKKQVKISLRNCGFINPENIDEYIARGGYRALHQALNGMTPEQVIAQVKASGLRGRGGAGFPTGLKWEFCRQSPGDQKYIICNADEGDPGAFMDRGILEGDPHAVIEGMAIGAYAMGAGEGYIYCRAEYPLAIARLKIAIAQAEAYGLLGERIFGTDFSFRLKIREGAGAFVCGEETALIASIEGRVGEPRPRPPFPAQSGLWGQPTNINNVKTWSHIAPIIARGADWYASLGTAKSKGTTVFSLVGKVKNSGLVEVPLGITLREMIYELGGGIAGDRDFKAVQTGGPSGGCIPAEFLDTPVDYESLAALGSIMGSGGMIVMDDQDCMVNVARYFLDFTKDESCGKCTPCREGTLRLMEMLTDITRGEGQEGDLDRLTWMSELIKKTALCGLGATAPNPVLSTLRYFMDEYLAHIVDKQCHSLVCPRLSPSPCQSGCPAGIDVPSYVALIGQGRNTEALELIRQDNPLASVCGYVCPSPCEAKCRRGAADQPIAIKTLKRFVADFARQQDFAGPRASSHRPEKVAIIGSGPAGLTAAYYLAQEGYPVTVFEAMPALGGMLRLGIPSFRLPPEVIDFDLENIARQGVTFQTNTRIGVDLTLDDLRKQGFQAFFLGTGAHQEVRLGIEGEDLAGVWPGVEFLRKMALGEEVSLGERVAIIGGGNVATDAARTAIRLGSGVTVLLYRRTEMEMPAYTEEVLQAKEEGVDCRFLIQPVKFLGNGKVTGIVLQNMRLGKPDSSGRRRPLPLPGSEWTMEVDAVIKAIGQIPTPLKITLDGEELHLTAAGNIKVHPANQSTNLPGVFAGGDNVTGSASVVEAVKAGKQAARSIHRYLQGKPLEEKPRVPIPRMRLAPLEMPEEERARIKPLLPRRRRARDRIRDFALVELSLEQDQYYQEACRCLRCDLGD